METMRERNYRTAESLRQRNLREQRRLDESLRGRWGMQAKHETKLAAVTREQLQLKQELAKIRTTGTTTTWGVLPPREDGGSQNRNGQVHVKPGKSTSNNHVASFTGKGVVANGKATLTSRAEHEKRKEQRRMSHLEDRMVVFKKSLANGDTEGDNDRTQSTGNKVDNAVAIHVDRLVIGDDGDKTTTTTNTQGEPLNSAPHDNSKTDLNNSRKMSASGHPEAAQDKKETGHTGSAANESADSAVSKNELGESTITAASSRLSKNQDLRRQSQLQTQTQTQAQKKGGQGAGFDSKRYNPDGSLRTVHVLPDFGSRWSEAKKARYIRHKYKPDHEKELSVKEMFDKDGK